MTSGSVNHAALHEPAPTGEGAVVLEMVVGYLDDLIKDLPEQLIHNADNLQALRRDLMLRAEAGKVKYGTYLRVNNGRNCEVDFYQEICDAIMYSAQACMEGREIGKYLPKLLFIGTQVAAYLDKQ